MTDPTGVHTCQTGRAEGATFFSYGHAWNCPFCGDHGPDHTGPIEPWDPVLYLTELTQDTP